MRLPYVMLIAAVALPQTAAANPKNLPLSYGTQTMPVGGFEIEQIVDAIPLRVQREKTDGTLEGVWSMRYQLTTELEFGLTDRVELGAYLAWSQDASAGGRAMAFDGMKQRARVRITEAGAPFGLAGYLEIAELADEIELEEKLLATYRMGAFELVANLWVEQEYVFADHEWKHFYNPTLGATYELTPGVVLGLEYWARGRFGEEESAEGEGDDDDGPAATKHYLGPTVMLSKGEYWMALGAYVRLSDEVEIGDPFGRVWVRLILGIGL